MPSPLSLVLRRACGSAPLLFLAGCPVDQERGLSYGEGVSSGSTSSLTEAGEGGGGSAGAAATGGTPDDAAEGGGAGQEAFGRAGQAASGGGDSTSTGGSGNAGSAVTGGSGGVSGVSGSGSGNGGSIAGSAGSGGKPDDGPCGDVDHNGVQDCDETLADNATFDANADRWLADPGVTKLWQADDARGKASGSVSLSFVTASAGSGWVVAALGQCLPAWSDDELELGARSFIPDGQGGGRAEVNLAIFAEDDCRGGFLDSVVPVLSALTGSWQSQHGSVKMPAGTRSVLVRLAAAKPASQASLEVHFDDILLRKK